MREYKKSYLGLVIWIVLYTAAMTGCAFLPKMDIQILLAVTDNITITGCFVLTFIIYKTEYIYWYNGTDYTKAKEAGSERRKKFALEHMKRFGKFALFFAVYSVISILLHIPYGLDITIAVVGIVFVACSTTNIKL